MKRTILNFILFFILVIMSGCVRKIPLQTVNETESIENMVIRNSETQRKIVSLPFEMEINENNILSIKDNGIIEFNGKEFKFSEDSNATVRQNDIEIRFYGRNSLFGIRISEQLFCGGVRGFIFVYNTETHELLINQIEHLNEQGRGVTLWDFFNIKNNFIVVFSTKAYAFDDLTGELLWTQTYWQASGRRIVIYDDFFLIDDRDGNRYKIFGDGRKEILL